ncbi:LacI family DNA-binding transcriptional regulator [Bifidobacterium sp. 82T24]|uniref:LacI family DNA-binding transcriptional regulator n=1 Tax=Bifidobacterium pluvialisilvae TaxID=2834436 RepID=UPI001C5A57F6|nr:LacI family DNA-binding transcriptional regulator [Bifidobacterium pluvialisilvae]MBW3088500.1 LacI family DNA-binding transcriptional regulator [Bifidobacterium pluvialisilvae]
MARRKTITIKEVARVAGVSVTTVSNYLNGQMARMSPETRGRVKKVIEDLHYQPSSTAQSMRSNSTKIIGVIVGDISNIFSSMLFGGIQKVIKPKNYSLMLLSTDNDPDDENLCIGKLIRQNVDGLIIQPTQDDPEAFYPIVTAHTPLVIVDGIVKATPKNAAHVTSDNTESSKAMCRELHERGYRRIVTVSESTAPTSSQLPRLEAVRHCAARLGMEHVMLDMRGHDDVWLAGRLRAIMTPPDGPRTAVFPLMGPLLFRTLTALQAAELRFPQDLGLVSFDDWNWGRFVADGVDLLQRDIDEIGRLAGESLLQIIEHGRPEQTEISVPTRRIAGHSL